MLLILAAAVAQMKQATPMATGKAVMGEPLLLAELPKHTQEAAAAACMMLMLGSLEETAAAV
jgi:hypothetical protein